MTVLAIWVAAIVLIAIILIVKLVNRLEKIEQDAKFYNRCHGDALKDLNGSRREMEGRFAALVGHLDLQEHIQPQRRTFIPKDDL